MPRYSSRVLAQLAEHGLRPSDRHDPVWVRIRLRDLYNYELRRLRDRVRAGLLDKRRLADAVRTLRGRYWLLSCPLELWTDEPR